MGAAGAGVGLGFIGNAMQMVAAGQAEDAMTGRIRNLLNDENYYQEQGSSIVGQRTREAGVGTAQKEIAEGTAEANKRYADVKGVPGSTIPGIADPGNPMSNNAWADLMGALRAPETGYSEFTLQQMIKNLRSAQQMGVVSQLARARQAILPMQLRQAQHSADELAGWGKVIASVGSGVGAMGGMSGAMGGG